MDVSKITKRGGKERLLIRPVLLFMAILGLNGVQAENAAGERVNICNMQTFSQSSGTVCGFHTYSGEELKIRARYRDEDPDTATVRLPPFGNSMELLAGSGWRTLSRRTGSPQSTYAEVRYTIPNFASGDYLDVEVYSERSNLKMNTPSISSSTGELFIPWQVTTATPFVPVAWTTIGLWATVNERQYTNYLGTWTLGQCANRSHCAGLVYQPLAQRWPISRGLTRIEAFIDSELNHAETDESDNYRSTYLDDFFSENVPGIMDAKGWQLGRDNLNFWIDAGRTVKSPQISSFDWNLQTFVRGDTDWFRDPQNATNNRLIDRFNELASPSYFNTPDFRGVIRDRVRAAFAAAPNAQSRPLSFPYQSNSNVRTYHEQHAQSRIGQSYTSNLPHLDAVTAAFGSFSYYVVPRGTAVKIPQKYRVTIDRVAIHVLDSFDFNGFQPLGCWAVPDLAYRIPRPWCQYLYNSSFSYYRNMKARGLDHNIFMRPTVVPLATPVVFEFSRQ